MNYQNSPESILQQFVQSAARISHHDLCVALIQCQIPGHLPNRIEMIEQNGQPKVGCVRFPWRNARSDQCWGDRCESFNKLKEIITNICIYKINMLPRISSIPRSRSRIYGSKCGTVVFGACGFEQSFMLLSVGRSLASKLKALSV